METKTSSFDSVFMDAIRTYTPLIFTLFYFVGPIANPKLENTPFVIFMLLSIYAVQVVLYHLSATLKNTKLAFAAITLSIALCVVSSSINQTAYAFLWFNAYFAALRYPFWQASIICAALSGSTVYIALAHGYHHAWFYLPILIPSIGLFTYGLYDKLELRHRQAQAKSEQELEQLAKVAERERIARDLHDLMGHSLTTIALKAQLAEKLAKHGQVDRATEEIREVAQVSSQTLSQMRSVISGYKAKSLQNSITSLCESLEKWDFSSDARLDFPQLSAKEESTISLILTEAITNIIKHSNGNEVMLWTETTAQMSSEYASSHAWSLHIKDNGQVSSLIEGNGLKGMRERVEAINAKLVINHENGFELTIWFSANNAK